MNASTFETGTPAGGNAGLARTAGPLRRTRGCAEGAASGVASGVCGFLAAGRGGAAFESALALSLLVALFAGLMGIAHSVYGDDRMGRAARAAARAVALEADASTATKPAVLQGIACRAIRDELDLAKDFDCSAWTLDVKANLTPSTLSKGSNPGDAGDMVLVQIQWEQAPWTQALSALDGSGKRIATGVARREPAKPGA